MMNSYHDVSLQIRRVGKSISLFAMLMILPLTIAAQSFTSPTDGMKVNTPGVHAFTNATIITAPGETIENGALVIRDGVIEAVGSNVDIPSDARVWEMDGKTIYPGFIDAHSAVGMQNPRSELDRGNLSWNAQIRAHLNAEHEFESEGDASSRLRSQGFTSALSVPPLGIFRGQTAVVDLNDGSVTDRLIRTGVSQSVKLTRSQELGFGYPTSPIGGIALIRQTLYDADWYERAHETYQNNPSGLQRPENNAALAALRDAVHGEQPLLFQTNNDEEILRAMRFTEEFEVTPWLRGNGHEYKLIDYLSERNVPLILPLNFPDKPEVDTPEDALGEDLSVLRHWYLAPENPKRLAEAGIEFSFTTDGLDNPNQFLNNLRKAVHVGLDKNDALAALTVNPASLLGIDRTHGTLEEGKAASFVIADGDLFENGSRVLDVWVEGHYNRVNRENTTDARGRWEIVSTDASIDAELHIEEDRRGRLNGKVTIKGEEIDLESVSVHDASRRFRVTFPGEEIGYSGKVRLTGSISGDDLFGWAEVPGQSRVQWKGNRTELPEESDDSSDSATIDRDLVLEDIRPAMEYGVKSIPSQPQHVLVRNATVWTMGEQGVMENADLLVTRGRVAEVGQNLSAPRNAVVIDGEGKHVTPGLIDAHLHSGVTGVNEIGNAIVPEVRMGDVLNINNIWMYRQLAGGLTTAHVMHGSANPIGGQNVHVKMRWGSLSDDLKIEGAPRTVKFALGENPKRVGSDRYPETRMGVEQIISDRFSMARDYEARWNEWEENGEGLPPRRDLRMDAIVDILNEDILVQSHSYRQDEILALIRLAEDFDFTIKAFHHGVEAYKVAPELAEHGAGAVVWSDWGGFKIEAYDNTTFNARLLHEAGVLTSLHSDNSQIATRMNWEAAKMVRAGVDPETALGMVTIYTAQLLGIDDKVGSLEEGKDGDFVIWSGDPLSTLSKPEQTWIDGRKYFDLSQDRRMRRAIERERDQLIQLILED
ncbi:MAG: amidohydrolase family protein [Balneolaceae bacterium]|nr:amidohydrolase family protein [Balneolaceae bacterium]MCH8549125.1 amidohydrolase family protein [Balneolaceae bacterium]